MEEYEGEAGGCLKLQVGGGGAETYKLVLGTFPKDFSQVATSQGYFPKWQLSKCAISRAATSQRLGLAL